MSVLLQNDYKYIDPYYFVKIENNGLKIINNESNKTKYLLKFKSKYPRLLEQEVRGKFEIDLDENPWIVAMSKLLKDKIILSGDKFHFRNWLFEYLNEYKEVISPKDKYNIYNYIVSSIENGGVHLFISKSFKDFDLSKVMFNSTYVSSIDDGCIENAIDIKRDQWVIIVHDGKSTAINKLNKLVVNNNNKVLLFCYEEEEKVIKVGPMIVPNRHGCINCISLTEERKVSDDINKFKIDDFMEFITKCINCEIINILIDEYFKYNSAFSSTICKQYSLNFKNNEFSIKQIRKNTNCKFCY